MTTREKALRLFDSFSTKANSFIEGKRCALVCVEEIIKEKKDCHKYECYGFDSDYWREVKQEIENL